MNDASLKKINRTLRRVFGLEHLRPGQREIIEAVLRGEDVLAIMPTGAGKSLCYQLPALALEGMTIVVSPLISLMKDQADKLEDKGLDVANLNSSVPESVRQEALADVARESSDFVFTTPERLTDEEFLATLAGKTIDFVVIDEAHCISNWGHDFRPAFLALGDALRRLGGPPLLALTATATEEVVEDIKKQLKRPRLRVVNGGIYRPNLAFEVAHVTNDAEKRAALARLAGEIAGAKIVYCATVRAAEEVAENLRAAGFDAECYHGRLPAKTRAAVQDRLMAGALETIVATNAFGMGIDKPDIRAVIHWQIPGSLEAYYQEAGRAGRDGAPARCALLYDTRDRRVQQFFLGGRYPSAEDCRAVCDALAAAAGEAGGGALGLAALAAAVGDAVSKTKLRVGLNLLKDEKIVRERRGARFALAAAAPDDAALARIAAAYVERGATDREKLEKMMLYAQTARCRWRALAEYFGSAEEIAECGACDNCRRPPDAGQTAAVPPERATKDEERALLERLRAERGARPELAAGDAVEVPKLGAAKIKKIDGDRLEVVFPDGARRTILAEYVKKIAG